MSRICASPPGTNRRAKRSPTWNVAYSDAADGEPERDLHRPDPRPRARAGSSAARATRARARSASCAARTGRAARGTWRRTPACAATSADRQRAAGPRPPRRRRAGAALSHAADARDSRTPEHEQRPEGEVQPRRLEVDHRDRPRLAGRAELGRADDLRRGTAATGSRAASPAAASRTTTASAERRCTRRGRAPRSRSAPSRRPIRADSVEMPGAACPRGCRAIRCRAGSPPRAARPGSTATSAVGDHWPRHREVRALDHQRPHQQEHERHAERAVLVLERRRRVAPAADEPEEPEDDDRRPAQRDQVEPDHDREREGDRRR